MPDWSASLIISSSSSSVISRLPDTSRVTARVHQVADLDDLSTSGPHISPRIVYHVLYACNIVHHIYHGLSCTVGGHGVQYVRWFGIPPMLAAMRRKSPAVTVSAPGLRKTCTPGDTMIVYTRSVRRTHRPMSVASISTGPRSPAGSLCGPPPLMAIRTGVEEKDSFALCSINKQCKHIFPNPNAPPCTSLLIMICTKLSLVTLPVPFLSMSCEPSRDEHQTTLLTP